MIVGGEATAKLPGLATSKFTVAIEMFRLHSLTGFSYVTTVHRQYTTICSDCNEGG